MDSEKIYTTDGGSNFANGALMGANLNRGNGYDMASMMNMFNNPFAYLMFMALFMNGGWGNNQGNYAANAQLQNLQTQIADNHNSDLAMQAIQGNQAALNQLSQNLNLGIGQVTQAVSTVRDAITAANGNVQLAAQQMISNNNLQSAALGTQIGAVGNGIQREILTQGYQNQIGNLQQSNQLQLLHQQQNQLISNGFTQLGFQSERNACDIKETNLANTQKIVDTLNNHWNTEQQTEIAQLKAQIATLQQTQTLLSAISSGSTTTRTTTA